MATSFKLDEIGALLFRGTKELSNDKQILNQAKLIIGTALTDSANGSVLVQIDDSVYSQQHTQDNYQYLSLSDNDDIDSLSYDETLIDENNNYGLVYWKWQDR